MKRFLFSYLYGDCDYFCYHTLTDSLLTYSRERSYLSVTVEYLERGVIIGVEFDDNIPFFYKRYCKKDIEHFCEMCYLVPDTFQSFSS